MTVATVGANGRWRWNLAGLGKTIVDGRTVDLAFMGDIREWMTLTEGERWEALGQMASARRRAAMADGPATLRIPRTALWLVLLGSAAADVTRAARGVAAYRWTAGGRAFFRWTFDDGPPRTVEVEYDSGPVFGREQARSTPPRG